jgi:hypothetical protein
LLGSQATVRSLDVRLDRDEQLLGRVPVDAVAAAALHRSHAPTLARGPLGFTV